MKKKTTKVNEFIQGLHSHIVKNPQFRRRTAGKSEIRIQTELRPLILRYLENYFAEQGYKDAVRKANKSFYWEGQEGKYGKERDSIFGARNYPDFIITAPYIVAIEYKQSPNGSIVKHGIGQSIMHTMTEGFHFSYLLIHDQSKDKKIKKSIRKKKEKYVLDRMWSDFNVHIKIV